MPGLSSPRSIIARVGGASWPSLLLLIVPLLLFRRGLGTGTPPFGGDVVALNFPLLALIQRQIMHGLLPLWNNFAGGGYPLVPFSGLVAYPPLWPLRVMDARDAITVLDMAHFAIAGLGLYMLAGVTGASRLGRTVGALGFMLSGFMIGHLYAGHLLELGVIAWMPWVFLAAHRLLARPDLRGAIWLGLAAGIQVLANGLGFLEFTLYPVAILLIAGFARRLRETGLPAIRIPVFAVLSALIAVGLSGILILPFMQSLGWSIRGGGLDYGGATSISMLPAALLMAFSPDAVGNAPHDSYWLDQFSLNNGYWHEFSMYMGLAPLLATAAACLYCRRQPHVRGYLWLALISLLLALGKYTPLYALAFHLPGMSLIRVPARWLLAGTLGVAVVTGPGVDWLLAQRAGARALWRALRAPLLIGVAIVATLVIALQVEYLKAGNIDLQPKLLDTTAPAGGRLLLFGGFLALLLSCHAERLIRRTAASALLLAFVLLDLWTAGTGAIVFLDPSAFYQGTTVSNLLKSDAAAYRVLTINDRAMPYRQGMVRGDIYDAEDFAPVTLLPYWTVSHQAQIAKAGKKGYSSADSRDLITCYDQRFASLLGVGQVVTGVPFSAQRLCLPHTGTPALVLRTAVVTERWALPNGLSWNPTWFQGIAYIYRNTAALPRAFLVPAAQATALPNASKQLRAVLAPGFDGMRKLVFDPRGSRPPSALGSLQDAWATALRPTAAPFPADLAAGSALVLSDTGNSVQVVVRAAGPSYLVLDDSYYPGWQVWIDGRKATIDRADYVLRAVQVPAGAHTLVFVYAPLSYLGGLCLTVGTAMLAAIGLAYSALRRRQIRTATSRSTAASSGEASAELDPAGSAVS